jgi:hypothetical protein
MKKLIFINLCKPSGRTRPCALLSLEQKWITYIAFLRSVFRLLVTANVPISPILVTLMMEAINSSEMSVLTRAIRRNIRRSPKTEIKTNMGVHRGRCVRLTSPPSVSGFSRQCCILNISHKPAGLQGLLRWLIHVYITFIYTFRNNERSLKYTILLYGHEDTSIWLYTHEQPSTPLSNFSLETRWSNYYNTCVCSLWRLHCSHTADIYTHIWS